jgi:dTDP-4-dehydrorhamnose 3,5-epimerase
MSYRHNDDQGRVRKGAQPAATVPLRSKGEGLKTKLVATPLEDVCVVEIDAFKDDRGYFIEFWNEATFRDAGFPDVTFVQSNESESSQKVLRGLHYQDMTAPMGKLVRCSSGAILDVAVDLRAESRTFGKWFSVELNEDNQKQLWVPVGFGHGFATLSEKAKVQYMCTGLYAPESEGSVRWDDPDLSIVWPHSDPVVSEKDAKAPALKEYLRHPAF